VYCSNLILLDSMFGTIANHKIIPIAQLVMRVEL